MSRSHLFHLMTAFAVLLGAAPARSAELGDALAACRAETDAAARLTCYDAIRIDRGSPPTATPSDGVADPGPASAPPAAAAGAAASTAASPAAGAESAADRSAPDSREAEFGLEYSARNAPDRITSTVVEIQKNPRGGLVMLLANDQVWQQTGNERLFLEVGDTVYLHRGAMTAFFLSTSEKGRRYRVARLR